MSNIRPISNPTGMPYTDFSTSQPACVAANLPVSAAQSGRPLSLAVLVSPGTPNRHLISPPPAPASPPGSVHRAAMLRSEYQQAQSGSLLQPVSFHKGKGRAKTPDAPSRSPSPVTGQKHARSSASPETGASTGKRINTGASALLEQGTSAHGAAASEQAHYYKQIKPRPEVAEMLAQGKPLPDIMESQGKNLDFGQKSTLIYFSNFLENKGTTCAETFANFYHSTPWIHEYHAANTDDAAAMAILRKLRSVVFDLPSQAKLAELASRNGSIFAQMPGSKKKLLEDAAGRLDELITKLPLTESLYQGPGAQQRFIAMKHDISARLVNQEWMKDPHLLELMNILRRDLYPLPSDDVLVAAAETSINHLSSSGKRDYGVIRRTAPLLSEIADLKNIPNNDLIDVLTNWKEIKQRIDILAGKHVRTYRNTPAVDPNQRRIFTTISQSLDELEFHKGNNTIMVPLANALKAAGNQAPGNVSASGQTA
ncbi:hypothetical protein RY831_12705 [Noviherbaspirillum sp. CPCC 100848]|uniref:Uncharacterized protein n=1 Tax=Noviherbaspirillum album TaxID=3080276 RepID=A0ABU6J918_9BURK|nr:hypothetical protein [Noviherbaspirillum sp. CPCC 100848]MEC4720015.1 hypothetical protein [Noviherbaspirillum sp. CPCC 100848]